MEKMNIQCLLIFICLSSWIKGDDTKDNVHGIDLEGLHKLIKDKDPHFAETFDDKDNALNKWVISMSKKEGVERDLASYDGDWLIDAPIKHALPNDYGLFFKQRAKHRAISAPLKKPFEFLDKPFILQYEVMFQEVQECGGGYIKMISGDTQNLNLKKFNDKTEYTIMFGPDKCGSNNVLHFIFRHKNPLNGTFEEKHCNSINHKFDEIFTDGKPHLFGLHLLPDNTYTIYLDHKMIKQGSLLTDFTPPVNPPAEVDDPNDSKPADWDDREKVPDPLAKKPDDWDEDAPHMIPDPTATKPDNWLEHEPLYIRDPAAEKPHDWDVEMDGEWEAPLVPNPACEDASGCGEWTPPQIPNPAYKGKWSPPLIENPNYKGKWSPRRIPNADFFEDENPFRMEKIVAVGFELWSVTPNIFFDNIIITDSEEVAQQWAKKTFDVKIQNIEQSAETFLSQFVAFSNKYPWLWALYTVALLVLITLIVYCCFWNIKDSYEHKKTDSLQTDVVDEVKDDSKVEKEKAKLDEKDEYKFISDEEIEDNDKKDEKVEGILDDEKIEPDTSVTGAKDEDTGELQDSYDSDDQDLSDNDNQDADLDTSIEKSSS